MIDRALFGRDEELRRLAAALGEVRVGRGRMFLLVGEPGIGKTRLCDELSRIAEGQGARVAWGRCWEVGFAPAYFPFTQIIRELAHGVSDLEAFAPLSLIAPELFPNAAKIEGEAREVRFLLFSAVARFLAYVAREAPLVLYLDDLHAGDEASLRLLQFVARSIANAKILIVATQRDVAAKTSSEVSAALHAIARDAECLALRRLSLGEVEQWIARDDPAHAVTLAANVHQATEGNPLFVAEVLRVARARGAASTPRIPDQVRAALAAHLELLTEPVRETLAVAALLGREFDRRLLEAVRGRDLDEELREAFAVGVCVERDEQRLAFVHILLRDELERALPAMRRAALHASIADALLAEGQRTRAVHHLARAGVENLDRAIALAKDVATSSAREFAFEDARSTLDAVAGQLPLGDTRRLELEIDAARVTILAGDGDPGRARATALFERARAARSPELMARAALAYGAEILGGRTDVVMIRLLEDALAALPPEATPTLARVMSRLGSALVPSTAENHVRAVDLAQQAIAIAKRFNDDRLNYEVHQWALPALGFTVASADRAPLVRLLIELAERIGDSVGVLRGRHLGLMHAIEEGDATAGNVALAQSVQKLARPYYAWRLQLGESLVAIAQGRIADADRWSREMCAAGGAVGVQWVEPIFLLLRASILYALDDPNAYRDLDERLLSLASQSGMRLHFSSWYASMRGDLDEARRLMPPMTTLVTGMPIFFPFADTAFRLGDRALAQTVYDHMIANDYERNTPLLWGPSGALCGGPTALCIGRAAFTCGRLDEAIEFFERALARTINKFPMHRAQAHRDLSRALEQRGDRTRAAQQLAEARRLGTSLGMTYFVEHLAPAPPVSVARSHEITLTREGDTWRVDGLGAVVRLEDRKGVQYLERLLREPDRELHVLDLVGADDAGDAGAVLDAKAKSAYRARLEELRDELEEARRFADRGRIERAETELDALAEQLARGVGLGGRDRKAASGAERARINVQRRLRDVLDRIGAHAPELGRYLTAAIRTGTYCSYVPIPTEHARTSHTRVPPAADPRK